MKVVTIIGARPQFIKTAAVSRALFEVKENITEVIVHTGQHYDKNMSDIFFSELDIPMPNYNLGVGGGSHGVNTGRMLGKLESLLIEEAPDLVLVYGDTDSTLAGALAASKLHIPIAHVEAGLRSFNRKMPEEINRVLTDHLSNILFAPTSVAIQNLYKEGISAENCYQVGDVMYDATIYYQKRHKKPLWFNGLKLEDHPFVLCTVHRAENTDDVKRLRGIFSGLARCGKPVIMPLHPRTRKKIYESRVAVPDNIFIREPVGYLEMSWLESRCSLVVTDSGGVQKEAYFHGKPCVTLRDETEWMELVDNGWNVLVGADPDLIVKEISSFSPAKENSELYGNGRASNKIVELLLCMKKS